MPVKFSQIKTVFLDIDGVLYRGQDLLSGVHELFTFFKEKHIQYAMITNNSVLTPKNLSEN